VVLVRTYDSEERIASIISVKKISELRMLGYVPPKRRFLQEPHGATSQKTAFFIVTAVKTTDLTDVHLEEYRLLGCEVWLLQEPTFGRNVSPPSSGLKESAS
jgi:hypothetical protein